MKRITPEQVLEAYASTRLKAFRGLFFAADGLACPISAIAVQHAGGAETYEEKDNALKWALDYYGDDYFTMFWRGFDGIVRTADSMNDIERQGYEDGKQTYYVLVEAGLLS